MSITRRRHKRKETQSELTSNKPSLALACEESSSSSSAAAADDDDANDDVAVMSITAWLVVARQSRI